MQISAGVLFLVVPLVTTYKLPVHEGSPCNVDGFRCTPITDCPAVSRAFDKNRGVIWKYTCTAPDTSDPLLVCCKKSDVRAVSSSERACRKYDKVISEKQGPLPLIRMGEPADIGEFPHLVALGYNSRGSSSSEASDISWLCSGSLISYDWVLTAAHCLTPPPTVVRVGDLDLTAPDDKGMTSNIAFQKVHPDYRNGYNDIALLQLSTRIVSFTDNIRPACLHQTDDVPRGDLSIVGYGKSGKNGQDDTNVLMKGVVQWIPLDKCAKSFVNNITKSENLRMGLTKDMICARNNGGHQDTCLGDSGGPLQVQEGQSGSWMYSILGVTSIASEDCTVWGRTPTTYTKVSSYLPWIESIVWKTKGLQSRIMPPETPPVNDKVIVFPGATRRTNQHPFR